MKRSLVFCRELKLKSDEQIFDALPLASTLPDDEFKDLIAEAMMRLVGRWER